MSRAEPSEAGGAVAPPRRAASSQGDLARVVGRTSGPVFAVVDGGHFDDLPGLLSGAGLAARSLFLGHGERESERFGPWFVPLAGGSGGPGDAAADTVRVLGLVGDVPAVVFWSCAAGDVALYGHLRRLNMARLPAWAAAGKDGPEPGVEADLGWEAVLFRHWDPGVLGALLPVLDEGQFARVLGPAEEVAFHAADYGGGKRVVADPDWPVQPAGMLTIRPDQVQALVERRVDASVRRQADYLRRVAPEHVAHLEDGQLTSLARQHQQEALAFGIRADAETFMWSFMRVTSVGNLAHDEGIVRLMADTRFGVDSEARLRRLFGLRTDYLRHMS